MAASRKEGDFGGSAEYIRQKLMLCFQRTSGAFFYSQSLLEVDSINTFIYFKFLNSLVNMKVQQSIARCVIA